MKNSAKLFIRIIDNMVTLILYMIIFRVLNYSGIEMKDATFWIIAICILLLQIHLMYDVKIKNNKDVDKHE